MGHLGCEQPVTSGNRPDGFDEGLGRCVLEQEARRTCTQRGEHVLVEVVGGQHEHLGRQRWIQRHQLTRRLDAVEHRHPDVHQHDIGPQASRASDRWPVGRAGQIGALARGQALVSPRRIGTTAASLAVTVALVTLLLAFNASLGASLPAALKARQHAEYTVVSTAPPGLQHGVTEVAERAQRIPGVATAAAVIYVDVRVTEPDGDDPRPRGGAAHVVDPTHIAAVLDVDATDGHLDDLVAGSIAVRDRIAAERGWERGNPTRRRVA